jgi:hypothetical protein
MTVSGMTKAPGLRAARRQGDHAARSAVLRSLALAGSSTGSGTPKKATVEAL